MQHKRYELFEQIESFINGYYEENREIPTIYDIGDELGLSPATVSRYLKAMEENGMIERNGQRDIITDKVRKIKGRIVQIPLLGKIACGEPMFADGNIRDYIHLPSSMLGQGSSTVPAAMSSWSSAPASCRKSSGSRSGSCALWPKTPTMSALLSARCM